MNFKNRLNSFNPVLIAQATPPVGNVAGILGQGIPLEALEGTLSPDQLKREGLAGVAPGGNEVPGFGPMSVTRQNQPQYVTDIPIKAGYKNIYGTDIRATYNPTTGAVGGSATIPIGAAEKGYRFGVEGSYNPGLMDPMGITPPPGFSGALRFSKSNPIDPRQYKTPGAEKYSFEVGVDGQSRRVPPQQQIPVQISPGPGGMFEGFLNNQR